MLCECLSQDISTALEKACSTLEAACQQRPAGSGTTIVVPLPAGLPLHAISLRVLVLGKGMNPWKRTRTLEKGMITLEKDKKRTLEKGQGPLRKGGDHGKAMAIKILYI